MNPVVTAGSAPRQAGILTLLRLGLALAITLVALAATPARGFAADPCAVPVTNAVALRELQAGRRSSDLAG